MKLLLILLLIGSVAQAQTPPGYTKIATKYDWIAGKFDSTFTLPFGTSPSIRSGYNHSGNLFYKTSDSTVYVYTGTQWIEVTRSVGGASDTLYILVSGQSNANGFNDGNYDKASNSRVQGWNGSAWVTLQRGVAPMGWCTPGVGMGACGGTTVEDSSTAAFFYLAKRLQERTGGVVRVIVSAYGGSGIDNWIPAASTQFANIVSQMAAIGNKHIDYFIWDQGEANGGMDDTTYKNRLDSVTAQLDRTAFFGKEVPIFIVTVRDSTTLKKILNIQYALGSGQFDKRYTTIDAANEGYYVPSPYHFSAQGQYNIGNKIAQAIFNSPEPQTFRQTNTAQRTDVATYTPTLGRNIILVDSTTKATYITNQPLIKTDDYNVPLTLQALNDGYGTATLKLGNGGNIVGIEVTNNTVDASVLSLKTSTGVRGDLDFEHRTLNLIHAGNSAGEWQFMRLTSGIPTLVLGEASTGINSSLHVGNSFAAAAASAVLELTSTTKGMLFPRMTGAQQAAISSPATGLHIYNTDSLALCWYNGSAWVKVGGSSGGSGANTSLSNLSSVAINTAFNVNNQTLYGNSNAYNNQTVTTYTLLSSDNGKILTIDHEDPITLTVPASLPAGFNCTVVQLGPGQITFTASSTTVNNRQSFTKTKGAFAMATIIQYGTNLFITQGDME